MLCRYCDSFSLHMDFCRFCRWRTEAKTVRALTPLLKSGEILTLIVGNLCGSFQSIWYGERTVHLCRILVPLGIGGESSAFYILWHTAACRSVDPLKSYPEIKTILEHMLTYLLPLRRALKRKAHQITNATYMEEAGSKIVMQMTWSETVRI